MESEKEAKEMDRTVDVLIERNRAQAECIRKLVQNLENAMEIVRDEAGDSFCTDYEQVLAEARKVLESK